MPLAVVTAFVASRLDYCNAVLYSAAKTTIKRLQTVMNAAARLVGGHGKYDHVTAVRRDTLHWLPIKQRIEFKVAVQLPSTVSDVQRSPKLPSWI